MTPGDAGDVAGADAVNENDDYYDGETEVPLMLLLLPEDEMNKLLS